IFKSDDAVPKILVLASTHAAMASTVACVLVVSAKAYQSLFSTTIAFKSSTTESEGDKGSTISPQSFVMIESETKRTKGEDVRLSISKDPSKLSVAETFKFELSLIKSTISLAI